MANDATTGLIEAHAHLEEAVAGPVWWPGDPGIDAETAGFNTAARHRPSVVVGATTASDVAAAVRYAARVGLPVGVHATGHGGVSSEAGVLVTTRRM
ncbi:MAG TPA: hypothetical protein VGD56_20920, partial [Gemmatirosa sp.]